MPAPRRFKPPHPCWSKPAKRQVHHLIWIAAGNGHIVHGCAHCQYTTGSHRESDPQLAEWMANQSRESHARACRK